MQEFTRDDKRRLRAARGERDAERVDAEKTITIANTQRDTAVAWLERYYLERVRAVVAAQAAEARLEIEAAEGAYRAGRGSQADIYVARAARIALEDRLSEFERRIRNARVMLARWVGSAADAPLAGEPAIKSLMFETHALDQALEGHPEIALLGRQVAVAESEVQLARANKKSDWSVELAYQERGPAFSNMISLGVSIPLQWDQKNRQDRELGAKLALVERAKALREDMLRAHTAEVRTMLNEWENGHERLARYERELIPLAQDRTQAALAAYRGGKADLNAVLAARRNEIEVRTQTVQLEMETGRLWAQLNFLVPDAAHESHAGAAPAAREEK
jgi:outer membrane protein TolC